MYCVLLLDMMDLIKCNIVSQILADIIRLTRTIYFSAVIDIDLSFANIPVCYVEHYEKMQY